MQLFVMNMLYDLNANYINQFLKIKAIRHTLTQSVSPLINVLLGDKV